VGLEREEVHLTQRAVIALFDVSIPRARNAPAACMAIDCSVSSGRIVSASCASTAFAALWSLLCSSMSEWDGMSQGEGLWFMGQCSLWASVAGPQAGLR
jgi:hypothetical protein